MFAYRLFFANRARAGRGICFEAPTPRQALTLAQRHCGPAHLFRDDEYLCTLECAENFWIISHDPDGARDAAAATVPAGPYRPAERKRRLPGVCGTSEPGRVFFPEGHSPPVAPVVPTILPTSTRH